MNRNQFDFNELQTVYGNDPEFLSEIISAGIKTFDSVLPDLNQEIEKQNIESISALAHKLKGTALTLCCKNLAIVSMELESMSNFVLIEITDCIEKIQKEIMEVKKIIATVIAKEGIIIGVSGI
jgi:HPt (histidine-containing phosphotransfer) domain-containing protein